MGEKTKAQLEVELKNIKKVLVKSDKALAKAEEALELAQGEATEGVGEAQAIIDDLNSTVTRLRAERNDWRKFAGGSSGMRNSSKLDVVQKVPSAPHGDHVCPRTRAALNYDADVYATEKRLRSERNAWRTFGGGGSGQRGPKGSFAPPSDPQVPEAPKVIAEKAASKVTEHVVRIIIGTE